MRLVLVSCLLSLVAIGCASKGAKTDAAPAKANSPAEAAAAKASADVKAADKASAPTVAKESTSKLECKHGKETRILEVRNKDKGCELGYTKAGQEAVVSTSVNGTAHCTTSQTKIKDKLIAAGYKCE